MSNPDFQQSLRDLAQAEQMRSAGESARNSRKLLEAQEKQAELEKQKLKIEQIRLQEERERHQALAKKAEAQKTIRVAMAGVEEELDLLLRRADSNQEGELVEGLSSLSFLAVLAEKKLKLVIQSEGQLEDLGDIRFVRSLKQKFHDIREKHPNYFGEAILQRALETLRKVAFWAQETKCFNDLDVSLPAFLDESDSMIRSISKVIMESQPLSSAKIEQFIESIEQRKQRTLIASDKISEAWNIREALASKLRAYEIGDSELVFIADSELDIPSDELLKRACNHQSQLENLTPWLRQAMEDWVHDRDLLQSVKKSLLESKFGEVEKAAKQFKRRTWTDLDVGEISKVLTHKRESLLREVEALASDNAAAISLAERLSVEYASSPAIADALVETHARLTAVSQTARLRKRNARLLIVVFAFMAAVAAIASIVLVEGIKVILTFEAFAALASISIYYIASERATERLQRESKVNVQLGNGVSEVKVVFDMEGHALLAVPEGNFDMGSNNNKWRHQADETPVRTVYLSAFFIGETEVTCDEWDSILAWAESNGYQFSDLTKYSGRGSGKRPATWIRWYDAVKWCNAKSEREGLRVCYKVTAGVYRKGEESGVMCDWTADGYRLPTEAEWEKAARGGLQGVKYPNGDSLEQTDAHFNRASLGTVDVGKYPANGYGLHDMAGNVNEWCWDWYKEDYYQNNICTDPKGPVSGEKRVVRGGCWCSEADYCRVSTRRSDEQSGRDGALGFRLVRR